MNETQLAKTAARGTAAMIRNAERDRQESSEQIVDRLLHVPRVQQAENICCFVSFRSEVETHRLISLILKRGQAVCVPWCDGDELRLCKIESLNELRPGTFGLLEPPKTLRESDGRVCQLADCQVAIVPGLAFTKDGQRLGYGRGYYDRLLGTSENTWRIAIAFDCQIVPSLPTTERDLPMHSILTQSGFRFDGPAQGDPQDELPATL